MYDFPSSEFLFLDKVKMNLKYYESFFPPPSYLLPAVSISTCSTQIFSRDFCLSVLGNRQCNLQLLLVGTPHWCHAWEWPLRDLCLNTWFPVSGGLGRIRSCGFSERAMSLVVNFEASKDSHHSELIPPSP